MKKIIGYQIVDLDTHKYPDGMFSFEVIVNIEDVHQELITLREKDDTNWIIMPIFEDTVENPELVYLS